MLQQYSFGAGSLYLIPLGVGVQVPIQVATLQETSVDLSWSSKELADSFDAAAAIARGALKVSGKIKSASFRISAFNTLIFGATPQTGTTETVQQEGGPNGIVIPAGVTTQTVNPSNSGDQIQVSSTSGVEVGVVVTGAGIAPGTTVTVIGNNGYLTLSQPVTSAGVANGVQMTFGPTITVAKAAGFVQDLGVMNAATGVMLTPVASAPSTGEYMVSNGAYTFAPADAGNAVVFDYAYAQTSSGRSITYYAQKMGPRPTFMMMLSNAAFMNNPAYVGQPLSAQLYCCGIDKFSLDFKNEDWTIPETDFSANRDWLGRVITLGADS